MSANETIQTSDTGGQKAGNIERYDLIPAYPLQQLAKFYSNLANDPSVGPSFSDLNYHLWQFWAGKDAEDDGHLHTIAVAYHAFELLANEVGRSAIPFTPNEEGRIERYSDIPAESLRRLAEHFGRGAEKYADDNWLKGYDWRRSFAALNRHLWQWWAGETHDPEMGSHHLTAVAWHAFVLTEFQRLWPTYDTRYSTKQQQWLTAETDWAVMRPFNVNPIAFPPLYDDVLLPPTPGPLLALPTTDDSGAMDVTHTLTGQHYLAQQRLERNPQTMRDLEAAEETQPVTLELPDLATTVTDLAPIPECVELDPRCPSPCTSCARVREPRVVGKLTAEHRDSQWTDRDGDLYRFAGYWQRQTSNGSWTPTGCHQFTCYAPFTEVIEQTS